MMARGQSQVRSQVRSMNGLSDFFGIFFLPFSLSPFFCLLLPTIFYCKDATHDLRPPGGCHMSVLKM